MFNIANFLQKYASIGLKEENIKKCLIEAISESCNVVVSKEKIKFSNKTILINVSGAEKAEIFMNRGKINTLFYNKINSAGYKISEKKII